MAIFKYRNYLSQTKNGSFDLILSASQFVPCAGIYRCTGCNNEIASEGVGTLPGSDHHKHSAAQGKIQWQLVVAAVSSIPDPYLHG